MKVKICPLCDSEMKKAHYCDTCHSFIWRPEILDVHYNAQQRGMGEEDCAYGVSHDQKDHRNDIYGSFSDALKKEDKKQKIERRLHPMRKSMAAVYRKRPADLIEPTGQARTWKLNGARPEAVWGRLYWRSLF